MKKFLGALLALFVSLIVSQISVSAQVVGIPDATGSVVVQTNVQQVHEPVVHHHFDRAFPTISANWTPEQKRAALHETFESNHYVLKTVAELCLDNAKFYNYCPGTDQARVMCFKPDVVLACEYGPDGNLVPRYKADCGNPVDLVEEQVVVQPPTPPAPTPEPVVQTPASTESPAVNVVNNNYNYNSNVVSGGSQSCQPQPSGRIWYDSWAQGTPYCSLPPIWLNFGGGYNRGGYRQQYTPQRQQTYCSTQQRQTYCPTRTTTTCYSSGGSRGGSANSHQAH